MTKRLFQLHGEFCASNPWEVIVITITLTACMLTIDQQSVQKPFLVQENKYVAVDLIIMTIIRCLAILYSYYHFRKLQKLGSKYILGIAGLFTVFSSFVFTSAVINVLGVRLNDLKDALFFFLLLIDLSKAATLAQFALSASNKEEVKSNIANGISILGPTITLDTLVEILVIGIGSLTGVKRLEMLSYFACLSVVVNYLVFMTFYPACLSLMLELSRANTLYNKENIANCLVATALKEEDQKSNPVIQRVKLIMAFGLMWVHIHSRWSFNSEENMKDMPLIVVAVEDETFESRIIHWIAYSVDHIVILILLGALLFKFIFFEDKDAFTINQNTERSSVNKNKAVQTDFISENEVLELIEEVSIRSLEECADLYKNANGADGLRDDEIKLLVANKVIPGYQLEKVLGDPVKGIKIRRELVDKTEVLKYLPYKNYDYTKVMGVCCENIIGYIPVPVGIVGPLLLDGKQIHVPMATTEGCLVASTNRGCRALVTGVRSRVVGDGMTRGPVVRFPSITRAADAATWMKIEQNFEETKKAFNSTSRFARLINLQVRIAGRYVFIRFVAKTGDAMGMNMLSKGTEAALQLLQKAFPDMEILSLSGNFCTDKKPAAVNWIEGRGKSVVCEAVVEEKVIRTTLKTTVQSLIDVNISKNLVGSAVAGSIGGFNAHAANIVTAIFIATGQDPAQNVTSSNCITLMEPWGENGTDLHISCTMPSIETGTIGGGTGLPAQAACLEMLGVRGPNLEEPGKNANQLAKIICATVLAGELSLMAALCAGQLVKSHLRMNRSVECKN